MTLPKSTHWPLAPLLKATVSSDAQAGVLSDMPCAYITWGVIPSAVDTSIDPATLQAYRETEYRVLGSVPAVLHIGAHCADLAVLHRAHHCTCSAFVTACNPHGQILSDRLNAQQQQALVAEISRRGLVAIPGIGVHPAGEWRGEASFLVPGLEREAAQELGRQFAQNAVVWSGADAVPELLLLR